MNRSSRRWIAGLVASALIFLSPGLPAYAQVARVAVGEGGAAAIPRGALPVSATPSSIAPLTALSSIGTPNLSALSAAPATNAPGVAPVPAAVQAAAAPLLSAGRATDIAANAPKTAAAAPSAVLTLKSAARHAAEFAGATGTPGSDWIKSAQEFDAALRRPRAESSSVSRGMFSTLRSALSLGNASAAKSVVSGVESPAAAASAPEPSRVKRAWRSIKEFSASARNMATGDKDLEYLIAPVKGLMNQVRVLLALDAGLGLAMAYLTGPLLDTARLAMKYGVVAYAPHLALLSGALFAAFAVYTWVEKRHTQLERVAGLRGAREYRVALQKSLVSQEMDFHLKNGSGALAGRLLNDTNYLVDKNVNLRLPLIEHAINLGAGVLMLMLTNPLVGVAVLAVVPLVAWVAKRYESRLVDVSFKIVAQKAELMRYAQESLSQAETVKTFAASEQELARYGARVEEAARLGVQEARLTANYELFSGALTEFFTKYLVYLLGGAALALGLGLTFGQVAQLTRYAGIASLGFGGLSSSYLNYQRNHGASQTVRELLTRRPKIVDAPGAIELPDGPGAIRFSDVAFAYPERKAEPVLKGLSFEARPGETVAFVGESGSGKSTLTRLLLRQWVPESGRIEVDGREIREVTRASLLGRIAVVPQETRLFSGTLRENMLFGREDATDADLERAIRAAGATYVYDPARFPQGLDTQVAEGGARLSGGERQRVAIVRALLRDPSILILDEATSALDNESERDVQGALDSLVSGAAGRKPTTIVVAHRLSTIRRADRINVLEKGEIVESGTHEELLARGGRYARLWREGGYDSEVAGAAETLADAAPAPAEPAAAASAAPEAAAAAAARPGLRTRLAAAFSGAASVVREFLFGDGEFKPFLASRRKDVFGAAAMPVLEVVAGLVSATLLGSFLDSASSGALNAPLLWLLSAGIIASFAVVVFAQRQGKWLLGKIRAGALADLRKALMARLHSLPMSFHLKNESAALASRLNEDAEALAKKNLDTRVPLLRDLAALAVSTALLFHVSLIAGAVVLAMIPILGLAAGYLGQKWESLYNVFSLRRAEMGRQGQETLEQISLIKTFAREDAAVGGYRARAQALVDVGEVDARYLGLSAMIKNALTEFFTDHLVYMAGAWAIALALGMTVGQIAVISFYALFIKDAFQGLSAKWLEFKQERGETSVVREWLRTALRGMGGGKELPPGSGAISFEDVFFKYDESRRAGLLQGLNLKIKPGTTVAIVGASGSGKSTAVKLLQGLWEPQKGRVLIDGMDQREASRSSLAQAIAKVPQETRLFDASIRYNMTYGSPNATDAELEAAIEAASAGFVHDTARFPQGLDTAVGEGGAKLSGGQRQRVAIVRALLKKPRILLLDEATSGLDKQTEREIQETLDHLTSGTSSLKPTTVVIAHNLTTVKGADVIVVLENGRVAEKGAHAELLARNGAYARLWRASLGESR